MRNLILSAALAAATIIGGLTWTDTAEARPWRSYYGRPAVRYYRPYSSYYGYYPSRSYYYGSPYRSYYYGSPYRSYYYGSPYRSYYYPPYVGGGVYFRVW